MCCIHVGQMFNYMAYYNFHLSRKLWQFEKFILLCDINAFFAKKDKWFHDIHDFILIYCFSCFNDDFHTFGNLNIKFVMIDIK